MNNSEIFNNYIKLVLILLLSIWCFLIFKPFIAIVAWAIIIAVAVYPSYQSLIDKLGSQRKKSVSILFALSITVAIIIPTYSLFSSIAQSVLEIATQIKDGTFEITPPTESVKGWPLLGNNIFTQWQELSTNTTLYLKQHQDVVLDKSVWLLNSSLGLAGTLAVFIVSFLIACSLMYNAQGNTQTLTRLMKKLLGENGETVLNLSKNTIRSVVKGILLIAIIQAFFGFIGFKLIGLPAPGIFALAILITAIIQVPALLTMIVAIAIAFSIADTTPAIIFAIYSIIVALSDNVLKPMLLGKGLATPMIIILIGAIGGMLLHGIIGLFIGAVVLAIGHNLYAFWVNDLTEKKRRTS